MILDVLRYEFPFNDVAEAERKIKRRLRYHGVGPYRQERVDLLRRFKDQIQNEIHLSKKSRYFAGNHGRFVAMEDFEVERMIKDYSQAYPDVPLEEITSFVPFAIYLYYMR